MYTFAENKLINMEKIVLINDVNEITEYNVKYAHTNYPKKWILIELEPEGTFSVSGFVSGDLPTFITNGEYVKEWKTFKGVVRFLKRCTEDGRWGMNKFKKY